MNDQPDKLWEEDEIDLKKILHLAVENWLFFAISIPLCLALSYVYTWYAHPVFEMTTSVLVQDESNDISKSILDQVGVVSKSRNIENEIAILNSRSLMSKVIEDLDININYAYKQGIRSRDLYTRSPLKLVYNIHENDDLQTFIFNVQLNNTFTQGHLRAEWSVNGEDYEFEQEITLGEPFENPLGTFRLMTVEDQLQDPLQYGEEPTFTILYDSTDKLTTKYLALLEVKTAREKASILLLTLKDKVKERGVDLLNALLKVYIRNNIEQKNQLASNSLKFIDAQLDLITTDLASLETQIKGFKMTSGISDVSSEATYFLEHVGELDRTISEIDVKLSIIGYLENYISQDLDLDNASPTSLGINDPLLQKLIAELNSLRAERKSMLKFTKEDNPLISAIDTRIEQTKQALIENIRSISSGLQASKKEVEAQLKKVEERVKELPKAEYELLALQRQYSIKESLYLLLLEKKSENSILLASTVSDNVVIDPARSSERPISPKKKMIYLLGLMAGIAIPSLYIALLMMFDHRVKSLEDVKRETDIPVIGVIPHYDGTDQLVVIDGANSPIAEAFRSVRTNLAFVIRGNTLPEGVSPKVIQFTSAMGSEGKSFCSINLAASLALAGSRTIVVGLDLRKPKLAEYFGFSNDVGASSVLAGITDLDNAILSTSLKDLDVMVGGPVPPNPSELLMGKGMQQLIDGLCERYDHIILDTPPVGLVTDSLIISEHAATTIYMVRQNVSHVSSLRHINELYRSKKIESVSILFNDVKFSRFGYGYGQGYGYGGYYAAETEGNGGLLDKFKQLIRRK